jgi:drug/metabolite transporter (DMT)-like permease
VSVPGAIDPVQACPAAVANRGCLTAATLGLVLTAAALHAGWNTAAKRSAGGTGFVWACLALSVLVEVPLGIAVALVAHVRLDGTFAFYAAGSGATHLAYFIALQRGYREGDLSVVYPVSRGLGPLLAALGGITLLHEGATPLRLAGLLAVVGGIGLAGLRPGAVPLRALGWAALTGVTIALYTVWDAFAVAHAHLQPVVYDAASNLVRLALLTPFVLAGRKSSVASAWRRDRGPIVVVALASPAAYLLVLVALISAPVAVVAPAREVSVVFATLAGIWFFHEPAGRQRVLGAVLVLLGLVLLALGR